MNLSFLFLLFGGVAFGALTDPKIVLKTDDTEENYIYLYGSMYLRARITDFLYQHQLHTLSPDSPGYFYRSAVLSVFTELDHYLSKPKALEDLILDWSEFLSSLENIETNKNLTYFNEKIQANSDYRLYLVGEYFFPQNIPQPGSKPVPADERIMITVIDHFFKRFIAKIRNSEWTPLKTRFKEVVILGRQRLERSRKRKFVLWSISTSLVIWTVSLIVFKLKK